MQKKKPKIEFESIHIYNISQNKTFSFEFKPS